MKKYIKSSADTKTLEEWLHQITPDPFDGEELTNGEWMDYYLHDEVYVLAIADEYPDDILNVVVNYPKDFYKPEGEFEAILTFSDRRGTFDVPFWISYKDIVEKAYDVGFDKMVDWIYFKWDYEIKEYLPDPEDQEPEFEDYQYNPYEPHGMI